MSPAFAPMSLQGRGAIITQAMLSMELEQLMHPELEGAVAVASSSASSANKVWRFEPSSRMKARKAFWVGVRWRRLSTGQKNSN